MLKNISLPEQDKDTPIFQQPSYVLFKEITKAILNLLFITHGFDSNKAKSTLAEYLNQAVSEWSETDEPNTHRQETS